MDFYELLEFGHESARSHNECSRMEYLSDLIFDFTTYQSDIAEAFARRAVEVCAAISAKKTFEYIEDPEQYHWYIVMVNMPFFAKRIEWGTSVRGAWWDHKPKTLDMSGLDDGDGQVTGVTISAEDWLRFIDALVQFATPTPSAGG